MSYTLIKNARIISDRKIFDGNILINGSIIECVNFTEDIPEGCTVIDAHGNYLSAGFIDIHVHGGGGYDFMDCSKEAFCTISNTHLKNGTTTLIATAVSAKFHDILKLLKVCKAYSEICPNIYGIHLEGPYISKNQKGAHREELLHFPTDEEIRLLLTEGDGIIKRITAAPELDGVDKLAKIMCESGVVMSLGHSDADCETALNAFKGGFTHITHLYSATPSVRKIDQTVKAGVIEAAYLDDNVTAELIADGRHAAVAALQLAIKIKGVDHIALTTDALRPAGTSVRESWLGEKIPQNRVIIEDGVAKLPDRSSFAGSIATAAVLLEMGVNHYKLPLADVVEMITNTPAKIMHVKNKGKIQKGYNADIVIFDNKLKIKKVLLNGKEVKTSDSR